ncbi:MAG: hypothetical protein ACU833_11370 [Gammaproteobacteria bacterium]
MTKIIPVICLLSNLYGCVAVPIPYFPQHIRYSENDLSAIKVERTSHDEVVELLGDATISENKNYYLADLFSRGKGILWVGLVAVPISFAIIPVPFRYFSSSINILRVLIEFDENNIVRRIETTGLKKEDMIGDYQLIDSRTSSDHYAYNRCDVKLNDDASASLRCCNQATKDENCKTHTIRTNHIISIDHNQNPDSPKTVNFYSEDMWLREKKSYSLVSPDFILIWSTDEPAEFQRSPQTDSGDVLVHLPYQCIAEIDSYRYRFAKLIEPTSRIFITEFEDFVVLCDQYPESDFFDSSTGKLKWKFTANPNEYNDTKGIKIERIEVSPDLKRLMILTKKNQYLFDLPPLEKALNTPLSDITP